MDGRLNLQAKLELLLGSRNVYFQPSTSVELKYPAIVYSRSNIPNRYANGAVYKQDDCYEVTVIDKDPDSPIVRKVSRLPKCRFNRHFKADNLNHDVFTLYE